MAPIGLLAGVRGSWWKSGAGGAPLCARRGWPQKSGRACFRWPRGACRSGAPAKTQRSVSSTALSPSISLFLADIQGLVSGAAPRTVSRARALPGARMVTASAVSTTCCSTHPRRASFSSTPSCPRAPTPPHFPAPSSRVAHALLCVAQREACAPAAPGARARSLCSQGVHPWCP